MRRSILTLCLALVAVCLVAPALASSFVLLNKEDLVAGAHVVVSGQALAIQSTRYGAGPIETYITVKVQRDLSGQISPGTSIYLKAAGGRFDGISEWMFGAAEFRVGEPVVLFLGLRPDGFFEVSHLFQGKFRQLPSGELEPAVPDDAIVMGSERPRFRNMIDLERAVRGRARRPLGRFARWLTLSQPEELSEFSFNGVGTERVHKSSSTTSSTAEYFTLSAGGIRWHEFDSGGQVGFVVNTNKAPLSATNTMSTITSALQAWNNVAGARIATVNAGTTSLRGADFSDRANVVSFGDPLNQITDPVGCGGTLGVTWVQFTSAANKTVSGISYRQILQTDVVFNNGFDCFLANAANLAEVAAHELGHGIGMGHSSENPSESNSTLRDALMYFMAKGDGRGASVRSDDIAAARQVYPGPAATGPQATGYIILGTDGGVFAFGDARFYGSLPALGVRPNAPLVNLTQTPSGNGYYMLGEDGGVFAFGDARFLGSLPGLGINASTIDIELTPSGQGYYLLTPDGGIFAFGDARFYGSLPNSGISSTAVDMEITPSGAGYWILGSDGEIYPYGDALFYGSLPRSGILPAAAPLRVKATPAGGGYYILGADGGIFSYGNAQFLGSLPQLGIVNRVVDLEVTPNRGYYLLGTDGGIFTFGDASFFGSVPGVGVATQVLDMDLKVRR